MSGSGTFHLAGLGSEAVPGAEVGMDEDPTGSDCIELAPDPADVDVNGAIAAGHRTAPDAIEDELAADDPIGTIGERLEDLVLTNRQKSADAFHEDFAIVDLSLIHI